MRIQTRLVTIISSTILLMIIAGCAPVGDSCLPTAPFDLSTDEQYAEDESLPFRFPLDGHWTNFIPDAAMFAASGITSRGPEYHAAEDLFRPAGTPVYAMADGQLRFSGPMGGYGWLIIIDHPQANLYSLYGHLSPSRWRLESGQVSKGDLIAYLGDTDENGGSRENPLRTHLHFGVRAGQRSDYPAGGQWRWMAGWIKPCPQDLGWLQPSAVITSQVIPTAGFREPESAFIQKWGIEILMGGVYLVGAVSIFIFGTKTDKPYLLLLSGGVLLATGIYFYSKGWLMSFVMFGSALFLIVTGMILLIRRFSDAHQPKD